MTGVNACSLSLLVWSLFAAKPVSPARDAGVAAPRCPLYARFAPFAVNEVALSFLRTPSRCDKTCESVQLLEERRVRGCNEFVLEHHPKSCRAYDESLVQEDSRLGDSIEFVLLSATVDGALKDVTLWSHARLEPALGTNVDVSYLPTDTGYLLVHHIENRDSAGITDWQRPRSLVTIDPATCRPQETRLDGEWVDPTTDERLDLSSDVEPALPSATFQWPVTHDDCAAAPLQVKYGKPKFKPTQPLAVIDTRLERRRVTVQWPTGEKARVVFEPGALIVKRGAVTQRFVPTP